MANHQKSVATLTRDQDLLDHFPLPPKVLLSLSKLGITKTDDLDRLGSVYVFLLLKHSGCTVTKSTLYQLEAIRRNLPQQTITQSERLALQQSLATHTPVKPAPENMNYFMRCAYLLAKEGEQAGEVPVGAIVVKDNMIIGKGYNGTITEKNICAHAEIMALNAAAQHVGTHRLTHCDLYVTLEPCVMCAGAILQARIDRLIFGAKEPKSGAAGSVINIFANRQLNTHTAVFGSIDAKRCAQLLTCFFKSKR